MRIDGMLTINKSYSVGLFELGWPCIFDFSSSWTLKNQEDHWGFKFYLVMFSVKLLELNIYDIRHVDDEVH